MYNVLHFEEEWYSITQACWSDGLVYKDHLVNVG